MTVWLTPDDVAKRLSIGRRTAMNLMYQMQHSVIGGTEKKRIRVSESALDAYMAKQSSGKTIATKSVGTARKLERR